MFLSRKDLLGDCDRRGQSCLICVGQSTSSSISTFNKNTGNSHRVGNPRWFNTSSKCGCFMSTVDAEVYSQSSNLVFLWWALPPHFVESSSKYHTTISPHWQGSLPRILPNFSLQNEGFFFKITLKEVLRTNGNNFLSSSFF